MIFSRVLKEGSKPCGYFGKGTASAKAQTFNGIFRNRNGHCGCDTVRDKKRAKIKSR